MSAEWAITGTIRLGKFVCEVTVGPGGSTMEWTPDVPAFGSLSKTMKDSYYRQRDAIFQRVANRMGGSVLSVNADGTFRTICPDQAGADG